MVLSDLVGDRVHNLGFYHMNGKRVQRIQNAMTSRACFHNSRSHSLFVKYFQAWEGSCSGCHCFYLADNHHYLALDLNHAGIFNVDGLHLWVGRLQAHAPIFQVEILQGCLIAIF
jgi:hypothetical protein